MGPLCSSSTIVVQKSRCILRGFESHPNTSFINLRVKQMTNQEMFEQSFKRPENYFKLSPRQQFKIDSELGILDWEDDGSLSKEDLLRFKHHYHPPNCTHLKDSECTKYGESSGECIPELCNEIQNIRRIHHS